MTTLKIQPVEYSGNGLDVLCRAIIGRFYPLIQDFDVFDNLTLNTLLKNHPRLKGRNIKSEDQIALDSNTFLSYLAISNGYGYILGVTSLPVRDWWFDAIWSPLTLKFDPRKHKTIDGQAGNEDNYGVAFVSTYRNSNRLFQGDSLEGLITTAVHEIGHIFGLIHHN